VERPDDTRFRNGDDSLRWAGYLADALLQAGEAAPYGGLLAAVKEWRDAGRPDGWGNALLHALDTRIE